MENSNSWTIQYPFEIALLSLMYCTCLIWNSLNLKKKLICLAYNLFCFFGLSGRYMYTSRPFSRCREACAPLSGRTRFRRASWSSAWWPSSSWCAQHHFPFIRWGFPSFPPETNWHLSRNECKNFCIFCNTFRCKHPSKYPLGLSVFNFHLLQAQPWVRAVWMWQRTCSLISWTVE